jgi:probable rRNA maturation factor
MQKLNVTVDIQIHDNRWDEYKENVSIERIIDKIIEIEKCNNFELSICLTNDDEIRILNKNYRNKDKPTNVLSFPNEQLMSDLKERQVLLGDIILSYDTIKNEASQGGKNFIDHMTHLIIHGLLHLLGYDHMDDEQAQQMELQEIKILSSLGLKDPYITEEQC